MKFCSQISGWLYLQFLTIGYLFVGVVIRNVILTLLFITLQLSQLRVCGTMLPVLPSTAPSRSPLAATSCPLLATTTTKFSTRLPVCPPPRFLPWPPSVMRPCLSTAPPTLRPSDRPWHRLSTLLWGRPSLCRLRSFRYAWKKMICAI